MTTLGIATFLGVIGVFSSFGILYIGLVVLKLNLLVLQSFIYLKRSAAGNLTVFARGLRVIFGLLNLQSLSTPKGGAEPYIKIRNF